MAVIDLSTIGIRLGFAYETTAGTKPSSFINIANPKSVPDTDPAPNSLDVTSLNDLTYKRYINGLKDLGGVLEFTIGMSQDLLTRWNSIVTTTNTNKATGKRTWFVLYHPGLDKSFYFTGDPNALGFPSAEVDSVWDATIRIAPTGEIGWATAVNPSDPVSA